MLYRIQKSVQDGFELKNILVSSEFFRNNVQQLRKMAYFMQKKKKKSEPAQNSEDGAKTWSESRKYLANM